MSSGLCKTLNEVFSNDRNLVNKEIVQMAVEQFRNQSTLMGVSQTVVHKVDQMHHDTFIRQIRENQSSSIKTREDIILLVRNFNFPMPNSIHKSHQQVGGGGGCFRTFTKLKKFHSRFRSIQLLGNIQVICSIPIRREVV